MTGKDSLLSKFRLRPGGSLVHGSLRLVVLTAAQTLPPATVILLLACHHRGDDDHDHSDNHECCDDGGDDYKVEGRMNTATSSFPNRLC